MRGLAAALFAVTLFGQDARFSRLATTHDGSQILFTTTLKQRGTDQSLWLKLFRHQPGGFDIVVERACPQIVIGSMCSVFSPQISAGGDVITHTTTAYCGAGSSCFLNEHAVSTVVAGGSTQTYGGQIRMSRNGRYLVSYSSPMVMVQRPERIDRQTGERTALDRVGQVAAVAADGSVLSTSGTLYLASGGSRRIAGEGTAVAMDDAATTAAFEVESGGRRRVFVVDISSSRRWFLGPGTRDDWQPRLSADGRWLLYLTRLGETPQLMFSRSDGSDWRQLAAFDVGMREAALSGDGRVAWAATGRNELIKIDTSSGVIRQIVAPAPAIEAATLVPGSLALLDGEGLPEDPRVTLDNQPLPVYASTERAVIAQVPWDFPVKTPPETAILRIEPGSAQFESAFRMNVVPFSPRTVAPALHEDFGAAVSESNPARPGEILHFWLTGLGPVDPTSRLTGPWKFTWGWGETSGYPAEVLFAGLAPGFAGLYQLDIRVPEQATGASLYLSAIPPSASYSGGGLGSVPLQTGP